MHNQSKQQTDTVHVGIGINYEYDEPFVHECEPGDYADTSSTFEADVPRALLDRLHQAWNESNDAMATLVAAAGFDPDEGRMAACCDRWEGDEIPGHEWWTIMVPASGDDEVWPIRDMRWTSRQTREEAEAFIASLPETVHISEGIAVAAIARDSLWVEQGGYSGRVSDCFRCGWSKDEHTADLDEG